MPKKGRTKDVEAAWNAKLADVPRPRPAEVDDGPWMKTSEAAAYLRVGEKAIRDGVHSGKLRVRSLAKDFRFRQRWLDEWLESFPLSA